MQTSGGDWPKMTPYRVDESLVYAVTDMVRCHPGWAAPLIFASSLLKGMIRIFLMKRLTTSTLSEKGQILETLRERDAIDMCDPITDSILYKWSFLWYSIYVDIVCGYKREKLKPKTLKAEFILKRVFLSLCRMRVSLFRMRILVCEVEKWKCACEKAMKKTLALLVWIQLNDDVELHDT